MTGVQSIQYIIRLFFKTMIVILDLIYSFIFFLPKYFLEQKQVSSKIKIDKCLKKYKNQYFLFFENNKQIKFQNFLNTIMIIHEKINQLKLTIIIIVNWCLFQQIISFDLTQIKNYTLSIPSDSALNSLDTVWQNGSIFYLFSLDLYNNSVLTKYQPILYNQTFQSIILPFDNQLQNRISNGMLINQTLAVFYGNSQLTAQLLLINKYNLTQQQVHQTNSSILGAKYFKNQNAIIAINNESQVEKNKVEGFNYSTEILINSLYYNWMGNDSMVLLSSFFDNYLLIVSYNSQKMELLKFDHADDGSINGSISILNSISNFQSICFQNQQFLVVHSTSTQLLFFALPHLTLVSTYQTNGTLSSSCFYDSFTESIILLDDSNISTMVWPFSLTNLTFINQSIAEDVSYFKYSEFMFTMIRHQPASTSVVIYFNQYPSCNHNYDYDPVNFICYQCFFRCKTCRNLQFCYDCNPLNNFFDDYCCGIDQYYDIVLNKKTCFNCPSGCLTCNSSTLCYTCVGGYELHSDQLCYPIPIVPVIPTTSSSINGALSALLSNGGIRFLNSIPASRSILKPILASFLTFDELSLYMYHQRDYGQNMALFFNEMQTLQQQKWSKFDGEFIDNIMNILNINITLCMQQIDIKKIYSSQFYIAISGSGQAFFANSWSYFTTTFIASFCIFIICKMIFHLLFKYRWSLYFRCFSFWPFFILMIMDGNLQQLVFFLCSNVKLSFSQVFAQKIYLTLNWIYFGILGIFAFGFFLLLFISHRKTIKYFSQNIKITKLCLIYLTLDIGVKNFILGFVHNLFRSMQLYKVQLALLLLIQFSIFFCYLFFLSLQFYIARSKILTLMLISFMKICMNSTLLLRVAYTDDHKVQKITNQCLGSIILIYVYLVYVSLLLNLLVTTKQIIWGIKKKIQLSKNQNFRDIVKEKFKQNKKQSKLRISVLRNIHNLIVTPNAYATMKIKKHNGFFKIAKNNTHLHITKSIQQAIQLN